MRRHKVRLKYKDSNTLIAQHLLSDIPARGPALSEGANPPGRANRLPFYGSTGASVTDVMEPVNGFKNKGI